MNTLIIIGIFILILTTALILFFVFQNNVNTSPVISKQTQEPEKVGTINIEAGKTAVFK